MRTSVNQFIDDLIDTYKFAPLPEEERIAAREYFTQNIPSHLNIQGGGALYADDGVQLCSSYNRIVVGDYGAYIEIDKIGIKKENLTLEFGQEWRVYDVNEKDKVNFVWLTTKGYTSYIKVKYQKKPVHYADYKVGYYYVSVFDVISQKN